MLPGSAYGGGNYVVMFCRRLTTVTSTLPPLHPLPSLCVGRARLRLCRARRLSELLGVAWPSVVSHLANEAASRGKVPEAVGLCNMLFRDKAGMDEKAAALALRDTAKALST